MTSPLRRTITVTAALATAAGLGLAAPDLASAAQHGHHAKPGHHGKKHHKKKSKPEKPLKNNKIVVQKSIGGFYYGEDFVKVAKAFKPKQCNDAGCTAKPAKGDVISAQAQPGATTLGSIYISATKGNKSKLSKVKTSKGIHIGSTSAAVKKAYPQFQYFTTGSNSGVYLFFNQNTFVSTQFTVTDGKVDSVTIGIPQEG